jgi:hypothetical protein
MNSFKPNNELEQALVNAATNPPDRPKFYRMLLESDLYLLVPPNPDSEDGSKTVSGGEKITFVQLKGTKSDFLPIFSSLQRLEELVLKLGTKYNYVALLGKNLLTILSQNPLPVILNPGATYGKEFDPEEISKLVDGSIFATQVLPPQTPSEQVLPETPLVQVKEPEAAKTEVVLGQPAQYPKALIEDLKLFLHKYSSVDAAYLGELTYTNSNQPPSYVIGLECTGDFQKIIEEATARLEIVLEKDRVVEFYWVQDKNEPIDNYLKKETEAFYIKGVTKPWWKFW